LIYISTGFYSSLNLKKLINKFEVFNIKNIEISSANYDYNNIENLLEHYHKNYGFNFLLHNYFCKENNNIILNTADFRRIKILLEYFKKGIDLSYKIGSDRYGIHAGFLFEIQTL